jgi:predicted transcriptional regulator
MVTTIQISETLQQKLKERKMNDNESYEDVILDLIEDSQELNQETLEMIKKSEQDIKNGKVYSLSQIKKELKL